MRWNEIDQQTCSVARTLAIIGDRWSMLILRDLFLGTRRFEDFCRQLGISRPALTSQLRKLEDNGVVKRRRYQERPERFEYQLTKKGLDLHPILLSMAQWGDRWQDDGAGAPVEYRHKKCDHKTQPTLCCSACNEPLLPWDTTALPGPGLKAAIKGKNAQEAQQRLPPALKAAIE